MKAVRNFAIFLLALALTAAGIGAMLPLPVVATVSPKLAHLAKHGSQFDALLLGSSRTYHQILPELLDHLLAEGGHPLRSFNLGVDGMRPPEDTYVLEKALAARGSAPLKLVVVECNPLRLTMREEDRDTIRAMHWHDWPRWITCFRGAFLADTKKRDWEDRLSRIVKEWPDFAEHTGYFFWRTANIGRGHEWLENQLLHGKQPALSMYENGPRKDGYRIAIGKQQMDAVELENYLQQLARLREKTPRYDPGDPATLADLASKQRMIEAAGARMVLIIPPFPSNRYFRPAGPGIPPVLDFSNPEKFPALFDPTNRSDAGHVNERGAEIYTRAVANALLEVLR